MTATEPCQGGYLRVHYTVTLSDEQPREMTDDYVVFFYYYSKGTRDASDLDTAEKLNAVFASNENFMAWLQEKHPEVYADSKDNAAHTSGTAPSAALTTASATRPRAISAPLPAISLRTAAGSGAAI